MKTLSAILFLGLFFSFVQTVSAQDNGAETSTPEAAQTATKVNTEKVSPPQTDQCTITAERLPAIRGLKFGMTREEVSKLFPEVPAAFVPKSKAEMDKNLGYEWVSIYSPFSNTYARYEAGNLLEERMGAKFDYTNLESVNLSFVDEKLFAISLTYHVIPITTEEFVTALATRLNISSQEIKSSENCNNGSVKILIEIPNRKLQIVDTKVSNTIEQRRADERKRINQMFRI